MITIVIEIIKIIKVFSSVINDGCDILVTIYELPYTFYQIMQLFKRWCKVYKGIPNYIIDPCSI